MNPSAARPRGSEPFRPRRGRRVASIGAGVAVVLFGVVAILMPGPGEGGDWQPIDRIAMWGLGWAIAALLIRYARIGAWPRESGLFVRNLILGRAIPWSEIEDVRFGGGEPWVSLDLVDGETVAVMAIQRADAAYAQDEAQRLVRLIETHQRPDGSRAGC